MVLFMKKTFFDVWGKYYGFPKCCVQAFVKHNIEIGFGYADFVGIRKLHMTGFVPCTHCNDTKTESELLSEIENNRICKIPFPQTNYFLEDIENIMSSPLFTRTEKAVIYSQYKDRYDEYLYTKQHSNLYKEAC